MDNLKLNIENKNKTELEALIKHNKNLLGKIKDAENKEETLTSYWQIRKNYEEIKHLYLALSKFVSNTYYEKYVKACFDEIYYYERLLQLWRVDFPENNIPYDYYIELARIEYDFFIKNRLVMPKEFREEIFHYKYKEDETDRINLFIILNNLKIAQKRLEVMAILNQIKISYDELKQFIISQNLGLFEYSQYLRKLGL